MLAVNLVETNTENIIPLTVGILRYKFSKTCTGHVCWKNYKMLMKDLNNGRVYNPCILNKR